MIKFDKVSKEYSRNISALTDISFNIDRGEFVFIVGPSGAGKTTLTKLLLKEGNPSSGEIFIDGANVTYLRRRKISKLRKKIGVVYQDFRLLESKNVYDNIKFALEIHGYSRAYMRSKIRDIMKRVDLLGKEKSMPDELSGGEKQRTSMARALVNNPEILIADEPTGNLDPITADEIVDTLLKINKEGTTVLMITHSKEIVDRLAKRVIRIEDGRVISDEENGRYL